MKLNLLITSTTLFFTSTVFADTTYVYCGLPDGSAWEWLLDSNGNYETIEGQWARVTEDNGLYFNVFRVNEESYNTKAFNCPAGYVPQPAISGSSRWEVFEVISSNAPSYLIDSYKTSYSLFSNRVAVNRLLRIF